MDDIELTADQEKAVLEFWNRTPNEPPALKDITKHVFGTELDGRSQEGRAIKKALSKHSLRARVTSEYQKNQIELSEAHKKYIENNAITMSALEIAKVLFANPNLSNLNGETRAVNEFIKTLDIAQVVDNGVATEEIPEGDYEPPKTLDKILRKVNYYVNSNLEKDSLTPTERKGLMALINYLRTYRFVRQMNGYDIESDRKSFEDAFVRYTYNKPELSQEEIDQYIVLANEVVLAGKAQRRSERLQGMLEEISDNGPENARIAMSLVEAIGKAQTEYNLSIKRQQDLLDDLTEKRSDKLSKQIKDTASVLNLLHEWKNEETRKQMLKLSDIENRAVADEVEKLASMEELKAKIFGLSKDDIKYG